MTAALEEGQTFGRDLEFTEGMQFDKGYISPYMVTDQDRMEAVLEDPFILIANSKIGSVRDILPILEQVIQSGRPLLIIAEDVGLAEHEQVLTVDGDLGPAVLAVQDGVALRHVQRDALLALVVEAALADGDDLSTLRLLLGGVGEHDAAGGRRVLLDRPHDEPIAQRLELCH